MLLALGIIALMTIVLVVPLVVIYFMQKEDEGGPTDGFGDL